MSNPAVVYKTKYDYSNNISVLLNSDKTQVMAYPGVTDASFQHPIPLANGYYLQRMVGNAFTSVTFSEYAAHGIDYTDKDLLSRIIDCEPFTEYWEGCGTDTAYINSLIRTGTLSTSFDKIN